MSPGAEQAGSEPPSKRIRTELQSQAKPSPLALLKNTIEINGKSCTHEVVWPPGVSYSHRAN